MNLTSTTAVLPDFGKKLKNAGLATVFAVASLGAAVAPLFYYQSASAVEAPTPSTVVVTPTNYQAKGWEKDPVGTTNVSFVAQTGAPSGTGALKIDTPLTTDQSLFYRSVTPTAINDISTLSYSAKRVSGPEHANPALVLGIDPNGDGDLADEVYAFFEPVYNGGSNYNQWNTYSLNTTTTQFWSFDTIDSTKSQGGANGANFFTLTDVAAAPGFENARLADLNLMMGSGTPGWSALADKVTFNGTTWDFEATEPVIPPVVPVINVPENKDACKNNGWKTATTSDGKSFKNQGQCVSYVERHSTEVRGDIRYNAVNLNREAWFHMDTASDRGWFVYADANKDWYRVSVKDVDVSGNTAWFYGQVVDSKKNKYNGQWLFAKVVDSRPDKIAGDFVSEAVAKAGVNSKAEPGPEFNVTRGHIRIRD